MNPFGVKSDFFEKFPSIEIVADPIELKYRVTYTECVSERGCVRFDRKTKFVDRKDIENALCGVVKCSS